MDDIFTSPASRQASIPKPAAPMISREIREPVQRSEHNHLTTSRRYAERFG